MIEALVLARPAAARAASRRMAQEAALTTERDRLAAQLLALTGDREKLEALERIGQAVGMDLFDWSAAVNTAL